MLACSASTGVWLIASCPLGAMFHSRGTAATQYWRVLACAVAAGTSAAAPATTRAASAARRGLRTDAITGVMQPDGAWRRIRSAGDLASFLRMTHRFAG